MEDTFDRSRDPSGAKGVDAVVTALAPAVYEQRVVGRPPETELVERARRGDAAAYESLLRMHEHIAFRTAYAIVGSAADAEECAQDAFVKAYHALGRFRREAPFRPWLLRIVAGTGSAAQPRRGSARARATPAADRRGGPGRGGVRNSGRLTRRALGRARLARPRSGDRDRARVRTTDCAVPPVQEWGTRVFLERAKSIFGEPLLLPSDFGDPDRVYWAPFPPGDPITAIWGNDREGRLVVTQWRVGGPYLFYKVLSMETNVESVTVDGAPGLWMYGGDHTVFYLAPGERNPDGAPHHRSEGVLAGNVLAWRRGNLIYRLEAQVSKQRALELARSLERG
jgi:sigma-70-like protein